MLFFTVIVTVYVPEQEAGGIFAESMATRVSLGGRFIAKAPMVVAAPLAHSPGLLTDRFTVTA